MGREAARAFALLLGAVGLLAGCSGGGPAPAPVAATKAPAPATPPTKAPGGAVPGAPQAVPAGAPVVVAAAPSIVPPPPGYDPRGRRDPFRPLVVVREAAPRPKTGLASLDPNDLKLTGIVWDRRGYYALVEAPNGLGYVIRANDVIGDEARVAKITPEGLVLEIDARSDLPRKQGAKRTVEVKLRKPEEEK